MNPVPNEPQRIAIEYIQVPLTTLALGARFRFFDGDHGVVIKKGRTFLHDHPYVVVGWMQQNVWSNDFESTSTKKYTAEKLKDYTVFVHSQNLTQGQRTKNGNIIWEYPKAKR